MRTCTGRFPFYEPRFGAKSFTSAMEINLTAEEAQKKVEKFRRYIQFDLAEIEQRILAYMVASVPSWALNYTLTNQRFLSDRLRNFIQSKLPEPLEIETCKKY